MRLIITCLFAALMLTSSLTALESMEFFQSKFVSYPQDDKNIVVTGTKGYRGDFKAILFNIQNDSHETFDIDIPKDTYIYSIEIDAESNRIAYQSYYNVTIFNYLTFEKIQEFELDSNIKMSSFSKDGSKYLFYNSTENIVQVYNIDDGLLIASHDLNPVNEGYTFTAFNQFTDQVAFRKDSSLFFWSLDSHKITNTIPFKEEYTFYSFENNGNMFSYFYSYKIDGKRFPRYVIGVALASDGSIKYIRDINDYEPKNFDFTSDMRHLLLNNDLRFQEIHDLEEDTYIYNKISVGRYNRITFLYISPDLEYSLIAESGVQDCTEGGIGGIRERLSTYNFKEKFQIRPLINTFVEQPLKAVISDNNKYVVINSGRYGDENVLVTIDEKFVKYLKVNDAEPALFIDQAKYIGFMYGQTMKFYNVETDIFEKELHTGLGSSTWYNNTKYYYSNFSGGRIIVMNEDTINIFNYSDLSLNKTIILSESGIGKNNNFDGKETLVGYDGDKIIKYNIFDESITSDMIEYIPDDFIFKAVSPNGRYVLYGKYERNKNTNYEVGIYDMQTDNFRLKDLASDSLNAGSEIFDFGLIGNLPIVWYYYDNKVLIGLFGYLAFSSYDFDKDTISEYFYSETQNNHDIHRSYLSNDNSYFIRLNCPWDYNITQLVDPQTTVETTTEVIGSIFPNPASDFIRLDYDVSSGQSEVQIYNSFGKIVMTIPAENMSDKIDISSLSAGVYFVKVGESTHKFIKH